MMFIKFRTFSKSIHQDLIPTVTLWLRFKFRSQPENHLRHRPGAKVRPDVDLVNQGETRGRQTSGRHRLEELASYVKISWTLGHQILQILRYHDAVAINDVA